MINFEHFNICKAPWKCKDQSSISILHFAVPLKEKGEKKKKSRGHFVIKIHAEYILQLKYVSASIYESKQDNTK